MLCSLQASQFYTAIYLRGVLLYLINDIFNEKFKKKKKKKKNYYMTIFVTIVDYQMILDRSCLRNIRICLSQR